MSYKFCFDRSIPTDSPVRETAARVYAASLDPVTTEDRFEAARHSSKRFWDVALLGGPLLVRHGGRAWNAKENDRACKLLLPGLALSAAAVGLLPLTAIVSAIHSLTKPMTIASPEAAFVHRLSSAIEAHKSDIKKQKAMTTLGTCGEINFNYEVGQIINSQKSYRVRNSNSLDWQCGVWFQQLKLML